MNNFIIHWTQWSEGGIFIKVINKSMFVKIETTFNSTLSMTQNEHKFADIPKIWVHFLIYVKTKKLINTHNFLIKIGKFSLVMLHLTTCWRKSSNCSLALYPCFAVIRFLLYMILTIFSNKDCSLSDSSKAILTGSRAADTRTSLQEMELWSWIFSIMPFTKRAQESFKPWCSWFRIFFNPSAPVVDIQISFSSYFDLTLEVWKVCMKCHQLLTPLFK